MSPETPLWENLKLAIADSSGFKCWQDDHPEAATDEAVLEDVPKLLDAQVRHYLRQTLETLAY